MEFTQKEYEFLASLIAKQSVNKLFKQLDSNTMELKLPGLKLNTRNSRDYIITVKQESNVSDESQIFLQAVRLAAFIRNGDVIGIAEEYKFCEEVKKSGWLWISSIIQSNEVSIKEVKKIFSDFDLHFEYRVATPAMKGTAIHPRYWNTKTGRNGKIDLLALIFNKQTTWPENVSSDYSEHISGRGVSCG